MVYSFAMEEGKTQTTGTDSQLFHDAFVASPIGIALEDLEGRPLFVNPALCRMLGFTEEEMRKKHCVEFSPRELRSGTTVQARVPVSRRTKRAGAGR